MLTMRTIVFLLVCRISLENTCRDYTMRTSSCPKSEIEWDKRAAEFHCFAAGRGYTCMILRDSQSIEPDYLVETCINTAYKIVDGFPGCPFIIACDKDGPLIGTEYTLLQCPETTQGCPPKNHGGYTINELFKYPACLLLNESDVSTLSSIDVYKESRVIEIIVLVSIVAVVLIFVIAVFILCRRRNQLHCGNQERHLPRFCVDQSGVNSEEEIPMIQFKDEHVSQLHQKLLEINNAETQRVVLAPLHHFITEPIEMIYAPVSIRKDLEETIRKQHIGEEYRPKPNPIEGPADIFMKNGKPTRFVMMQGEAGRGKSVYCLKLVKEWCKAKQVKSRKGNLSNWEKCMDTFDFLFLVILRHVMENMVLLLDMICNDLEAKGICGYGETVRAVLSSGKYKCLIIIDGLDEWKGPYNVTSENEFPGVPNLKGISVSTCTFFFTMRPWKFEAVVNLIRMEDRVVEIQGLDEKRIKELIHKLLINHFKLKENSSTYKKCLKEIQKKANNEKIKSLLQIPLVAVVSVLLWLGKEKVGNSLTMFYLAIIRMLIERAVKNKLVDEELTDESRQTSEQNFNIPTVLQNDNTLLSKFDILYRLGEVAFRDLILKHSRLVFEKAEILKKIGKSELEFALMTGILSKSEEFVSVCAAKTCPSVSFFHKTVQELLTALHVSSNKEASGEFKEHLSSIEVVMEFENVNIFLSGLSPSLGKVIAHHIVEVANRDQIICRYRKTFKFELQNKVELLYRMQLNCLRELPQSGEDISLNTQQRDYHISDVYVDRNSDIDTVRMTANVLRKHNVNIVSLQIDRVPNDGQDGIVDAVINDYLQQTTTLKSLFINGGGSNRTLHTIKTVASFEALVLILLNITTSLLHDIKTSLNENTKVHTLGLVYPKCEVGGEGTPESEQTLTTSFCGVLKNLPSCKHLSELHISYMIRKEERDMFVKVLPRLSHLKVIDYYGSTYFGEGDGEYDFTIVNMVSQWTRLHMLQLANIFLGDQTLTLAADMDQIKEVELYSVKMSAGGWGKCISSLANIQHQFDVKLSDTNISTDCVRMIRSSPHFTVTYHDEGESEISFSRKFPLTLRTQEHSDGDDHEDKQTGEL